MKRTILVVTPALIARGDFDPRGLPTEVAHAAPPTNVSDVPSLMLAALGLLKAAPRRIYLLTTFTVTAVLETTAGRFHGLDATELASALAFEAEAMTGLPALASQTATCQVAGSSGAEAWWVTQITQRLRGEIEIEVLRRGARLEGIAHPGGLVMQLGTAVERFELWHDLLFIHRPQSPASFDILAVDESATLPSVMARFPSAGHTRLILTTTHQAQIADLEVLSLLEDDTLRSWLTSWNQALGAANSALPVLRPPTPALSGAKRLWLSMATASIVLLLCFAHWSITERQLQHAQEELKTLSALAKQRDDLKQTSADIAKLRTELESARRLQGQALRGFGALLTAVAQLRPSGLLVRTLKEPGGSVPATGHYTGMEALISGLCTHQELAAEFSRTLGERLTPLGWTVRPARTTARLAGGTPVWDFEIPLRLDGTIAAASNPQTASAP